MHDLPQSRSVSVPGSNCRLKQASVSTQIPAEFEQSPDSQSKSDLQSRPVAHLSQVFPPQSTSVSAAFSTSSSQVGAIQTRCVHTSEIQSSAMLHLRPVVQALQDPPQSVSVSSPSRMSLSQETVSERVFTENPSVSLWVDVRPAVFLALTDMR